MKISPRPSAPYPAKPPQKVSAPYNALPQIKVAGLNSSGTAAARSVPALLASLGLPADRLSASIVPAAKFFALPLEPALLAQIRRQALAAGTAPQAETLSLAAAAAADKGVELSRAGLEDYAAALETTPIDPDSQEGQNPEMQEGQQGRRNPERRRSQERADPEIAAIANPQTLKETVLAMAGQNPLLDILNRLPGKNGQRWLVFPFNFMDQGDEYRVSLKILLGEHETGHLAGRTGCLTLEITKSGRDKRRWLFVLDRAGGKNLHITVYLQPAYSKKALKSLVQEIAQCLEISPDGISIQNYKESFSFMAENRDDVLLSINEEV
ncbi:hypothetical protein AGMMS50293_05400 [Spirochaetia bacterium]|nr:hypothetical protein AGMMS50293_05400 [Spirochaetia bacterium]